MHRDPITFMIVPENRKHPLKLRMSMQLFRILLVIFTFLTFLFIVGAVMGGKYLNLYVEYKTLSAQNKNLKNQLEKVRQLETRLQLVEEIECFLYALLTGEGGRDTENPLQIEYTLQNDFSSKNIPDPSKRYKFIPEGLPQNGVISMGLGERGRMYDDTHRGVDIALPPGKPVFSTGAGRVVFAGYDNDLGISVTIDHLNGYVTKYGHLNRLNVEAGSLIDRNYIIGFSGDSGRSIGTHIHYVVLKDGVIVAPLEKRRYITQEAPKEDSLRETGKTEQDG